MKKSIVLLIFLCCTLNAFNQVITGSVCDVKDKKPIPFAYIYISGTMVVTNSDQNGYFKLDISKYPALPLTISGLGYNQVILNDFSKFKPVTIFLTPKIFELSEVVVSDKSLARARNANLKLFRSSFLGKTPNGLLSTILNENDIHFIYDKSDTVKAYSSAPLIIENRGLGYIVTFFLDEFEYDSRNKSWFFLGNILFNEDMNMEESLKQRYERRRRNAFMGSKMHFFRALWKNELESAGFQVRDNSGNSLNQKDFVIEGDSVIKYLWYPEKLLIYYRTDQPPSSIDFKQDEVLFEKSGFYDALGIIWGGQMSKQLIGDWLPYEYSTPEE
jgi:hypothetical protein